MAARKQPRDRYVLHRTAEPLEPAELPFYVQTPIRPREAAGWYWVPAGADEPEYLGHNVYAAQAALVELVNEARAAS